MGWITGPKALYKTWLAAMGLKHDHLCSEAPQQEVWTDGCRLFKWASASWQLEVKLRFPWCGFPRQQTADTLNLKDSQYVWKNVTHKLKTLNFSYRGVLLNAWRQPSFSIQMFSQSGPKEEEAGMLQDAHYHGCQWRLGEDKHRFSW